MPTIKFYTEEIAKNPNDTELYLNRGDIYYQNKDYENALKDYEKAIELGEDLEEDVCYQECLDFKKANEKIEVLTKSIEKDSQNIYNYTSRAYLYSLLKEYSKAIADISKAIEIKPSATLFHARTSLCEDFIENDLTKAIEISEGKQKVASFWYRGTFYKEKYLSDKLENEDYLEKAEEDYDSAIEFAENKAQANYEKARFYEDVEDYEKAIIFCKEAVNIADKEDEVLMLAKYTNILGELYFKNREYENSIKIATDGLKLATDEHEIMNLLRYRGESYKQIGDLEKAKEDEHSFEHIFEHHHCEDHHCC